MTPPSRARGPVSVPGRSRGHATTRGIRRLSIGAVLVITMIGGCVTFEPSGTPPPGPSAGPSVVSPDPPTAASPSQPATALPRPTDAPVAHDRALVSLSFGDAVAIVDTSPTASEPLLATIVVGDAPWGIALGGDGLAWVATVQGVAVVDLAEGRRVARVRYSIDTGPARTGEFRPGGMGIAITPDGAFVAVGVLAPGARSSVLDVIDTTTRQVVRSVAIGIRPFDVVMAPDGQEAYAVDHDSYSVTAVDLRTGRTRTLAVEPLGPGAFDKPHYAAVAPDGRLLLPVQGRVIAALDPRTGDIDAIPQSADTHQHGVALAPDGRLAIVGTGPAGAASGGPNLAILDLAARTERIISLARRHEDLAFSTDGGSVLLTGGYTLGSGAWDGISVVDLETSAVREIAVPDRPLDIVILPPPDG